MKVVFVRQTNLMALDKGSRKISNIDQTKICFVSDQFTDKQLAHSFDVR